MSRNPLFGLLAVWIGWAAGFLLIYALQATGCRMGWNDQMIGPISALRLLLITTTAALVLGFLALWWKTARTAPASSLARISNFANGAAILATLCFAGVLWLSLCA